MSVCGQAWSLRALPAQTYEWGHEGAARTGPVISSAKNCLSQGRFTSVSLAHRSSLYGSIRQVSHGRSTSHQHGLLRGSSSVLPRRTRADGTHAGRVLATLEGESTTTSGEPAQRRSSIKLVKVIKWAVCAAAAVLLSLPIANATILNPSLWTYLSWLLVVWPWPAAIGLGAFALSRAARGRGGPPLVLGEQLLALAAVLTWLILVPAGLWNGHVDGWPLGLFFFYGSFIASGALVRLQLYGDLASREADTQWSTGISRGAQVAFVLAMVAGHWLAARESPVVIPFSPAWDLTALALLLSALWLHARSTFYLGKYFDRLVVPLRVVVFGPYRFVRHPIYTSYMLLFSGYCVALRAPVTAAFLLLACYAYYELRTELEERLLLDNFQDSYSAYKHQTPHKYLPGVI